MRITFGTRPGVPPASYALYLSTQATVALHNTLGTVYMLETDNIENSHHDSETHGFSSSSRAIGLERSFVAGGRNKLLKPAPMAWRVTSWLKQITACNCHLLLPIPISAIFYPPHLTPLNVNRYNGKLTTCHVSWEESNTRIFYTATKTQENAGGHANPIPLKSNR